MGERRAAEPGCRSRPGQWHHRLHDQRERRAGPPAEARGLLCNEFERGGERRPGDEGSMNSTRHFIASLGTLLIPAVCFWAIGCGDGSTQSSTEATTQGTGGTAGTATTAGSAGTGATATTSDGGGGTGG